ncbi:MAG: hypothetical protein M3Q71_22580, partial [Chloroflexota bacterium]|nr:hypothetical protein [Chloroflexota bacterium]
MRATGRSNVAGAATAASSDASGGHHDEYDDREPETAGCAPTRAAPAGPALAAGLTPPAGPVLRTAPAPQDPDGPGVLTGVRGGAGGIAAQLEDLTLLAGRLQAAAVELATVSASVLRVGASAELAASAVLAPVTA